MLYKPSTSKNGSPRSSLRAVLEAACKKTDCGLANLTVLSAQVDPYRLDTPSAHRDGEWVGEHLDRLVGRSKKIHWRGLHYVLVSTSGLVKPNGEPRQAFQFVIFGEKASLRGRCPPDRARSRRISYLPTGEISDTLLYRIAKDAAADGRPMVMFVLADCDPAGYQMAVSIGRKLLAFRDHRFPKLKFEIVPIALTVQQVRELGLPSTPLKETEKRASRWRQAFGVEQTEIDALATLQPDVLRQIIEAAFAPYYDTSLEERVDEARTDWMVRAQAAIDEQVDPEVLAVLRAQATEQLAGIQSIIADLNERFRLAADRFTLPAIEVPRPELDEDAERQALISLNDSWVTATRALIARKQYGNGHD